MKMSQKLINKKMYKANDMWDLFRKEYPKLAEKYNYKIFKEVISRFNVYAEEEILDGGSVNLGNGVGSLYIKRVKRKNVFLKTGKMSPRSIDWKKTKELRKKGINKIVYFMTPYYCMHSWRKGLVKNKSVYSFIPTKGPNGNTRKLSRLLVENPLHELNYMK